MRALLIASALVVAPSMLGADDPCRGKPEDEACREGEEGPIQNMATQLLQSRTVSMEDPVNATHQAQATVASFSLNPNKVSSSQFNCTAVPYMCGAPFHCDDKLINQSDIQALGRKVAVDGHVNFGTWCSKPAFWSNLVKNCLVDHDLRKNALTNMAMSFSSGLTELDASHCFWEGHCSDTEVTYNTTVGEAEALCDKKYPSWTSIGEDDHNLALDNPGSYALQDGYLKAEVSHAYGSVACAMGKYHCDVVYCKETYCKMPHYRSKYGHLEPSPQRR